MKATKEERERFRRTCRQFAEMLSSFAQGAALLSSAFTQAAALDDAEAGDALQAIKAAAEGKGAN